MKKRLIITLVFAIIFNAYSQQNYPLETVLQTGHLKYVSCSAFSPDGKYIATGGHDNTIKLWNIENGRQIRSFNQHTDKIKTVAFSPDGTKLLSASSDNKAIVFDVLTANVLAVFVTNKDALMGAYFSPDGSKVITMTNRDQTQIWDIKTASLLGTYKKGFSAKVHSLWFSPDGTKVLSYSNYKEAKLINIESKKDVLTLPFDKTNSMSYSPNGKYIAIGSAKLFAKVFDAETGKEINRFKDNENIKCDGCNTVIAFSHSSKILLTGSDKTGITQWDIETGKKIKNIKTNKERLRFVKFSPNDKYILAKTDKKIFIFDAKSGKQIFDLYDKQLNYFEPYFSPSSKSIITPHKNNTVAIWNIETSKITQIFKGYLNKKRNDGLKFKQTDWTAKNILKYITMKPAIAISPDGKYIAKGKIDSIVVMIDIATGKIVKQFVGHNKIVFGLDFSSDGKMLATCGGDRQIKIWNTQTAEEIITLIGHKDLVFDVKFSSDNKYLISGSWDGTLRIWEVATGKTVQYINLKTISPYVVGFSANDLYAVSSDLGKNLKFWESDSGKEFRQIVGHTDIVADFVFTPEKRTMITASWDGTIKVWDVLTGMLINKFTSHNGAVNSVACDPKGKYIVSASSDRSIKFWDIATGKELRSINAHSNSVTSVKITPDGDKLISCSVEGVVKVWDLKTFQEIYTYIQIDRQNWLSKNPQGYFDGSKQALKSVNYVSGMEVVSVGSLFEKYYTPNLIKRLMEGEKFSETNTDLNKVMKESPQVDIKVTKGNTQITNVVSDSTYKWRDTKIPITVDVTKQGGELDEIRIYNNEKLVLSEPIGVAPVFRGVDKFSKTYDINLLNGYNNIRAVVINKQRTESLPKSIKINYDGEDALTDLYIFAIGINEYKNPKYNLKYAINDAKAYVDTVSKNSKDLFNKIEITFVKNEEANKTNIISKIKDLSVKVGPEDVFLFYYAGHGVMSIEKDASEFFIVTYDVTNLYGDTKMLKEKAISASEILSFSKNIIASKQLFVLDACQSGGAIDAFASRGSGKEKAIAQLARSTGTFFLTASQDVQYANEVGNLKHGLFTYALLEALSGKADGGANDNKITVNEIKSYVEDRVPQLSEKYHGSAQYPAGYSFGQDFPIVYVK